jgi:tetratricopeptide (TPR) repeat protein
MDQFQAYYAKALEFARQAGSVMDEAHILAGLGWASIDLGRFADAEHYYREAEALSSRLHSVDTMAYVKLGWAFVNLMQGKTESARRLAHEGLALAREFNATSNESVAFFILSLLASLNGDNVTARQLAERSLRYSPVLYFRSYTEWSLAMAHCGLGNRDAAWRFLRSSLDALRVDSAFSRLLTVAAVLMSQQGDEERAVEVLGSVYSDRGSAHGWMEEWPPLTREHAHLRSKLDPTVYQGLWECGAQTSTAALADSILRPSA